ncbi:MAG TPA: kelch repeat-containing protein [Bryobacteraceae bacterium]|nr:kelch repeat-containing protein [Bryobacteraceae bacterium]
MTGGRKKLQSKGSIIISALFFLGSAVALAQSGGTFTPTGSMTVTRSAYTATLLPSGKVLIAGGYSPTSDLASAELYDPATGTFSATGDMTAGHSYHSATLLPNGEVLIAGGIGRSNGVPGSPPRVPNAELYDPFTGTFSVTGDMVETTTQSAAFLLASGKVLIAHDIDGLTPATAELYDPVTGTFSSTGNQVRSSGTQQGALLADGRVLLVICCMLEQVYDPARGTFDSTGVITNVYQDGFASALPAAGRFLVTGGFLEEMNSPSAGACVYDSVTGVFAATGNMTTARYYHTATALGDGTVLIAGGEVSGHILLVTESAELYDPATGAFSPTGDMTTARMNHTATLLLDGTVLIAGGGTASAKIYHPAGPVSAPALFSTGGDAQGQGAIWHSSTGEIASAADPAVAGEALSMYTTSFVEGGAIPPQVAIAGRLGEILYFGDAPGYPGYYQVNFRVPDGISPGPAVSVRLTYLGRPSKEVTIAVQ